MLLRRQRDLYRRLSQLVERQRSLVTAGDPAPLLGILGERQEVVGQLVQLSRDLAPHRDRWSSTRERFSASDRAEAEAILTEVNTVLGRVMDADERDARLLSARKGKTAQALQGMSTDRSALAAYASSSSSQAADRLNEES